MFLCIVGSDITRVRNHTKINKFKERNEVVNKNATLNIDQGTKHANKNHLEQTQEHPVEWQRVPELRTQKRKRALHIGSPKKKRQST